MISSVLTSNIKSFLLSTVKSHSGFDSVRCVEHENNNQIDFVQKYVMIFSNHKSYSMGEVSFVVDYQRQLVEVASTTGCFASDAYGRILEDICEDVKTYMFLAAAMMVHVVTRLTNLLGLEVNVEFIDAYNLQFAIATSSGIQMGTFVVNVDGGMFSVLDVTGIITNNTFKDKIIDIIGCLNE